MQYEVDFLIIKHQFSAALLLLSQKCNVSEIKKLILRFY